LVTKLYHLEIGIDELNKCKEETLQIGIDGLVLSLQKPSIFQQQLSLLFKRVRTNELGTTPPLATL
jgi:hypothetical protein